LDPIFLKEIQAVLKVLPGAAIVIATKQPGHYDDEPAWL
jgi:hypothetical protein